MNEPYLCKPLCRIVLAFEPLAEAIGPAGDILHLPIQITAGTITGADLEGSTVSGTDLIVVYADEKMTHHGQTVISHASGPIILRYTGTSDADAGAYDDLVDGILPGNISTRLVVESISSRPDWRRLNREPLLAIGSLDCRRGALDLVLLSMP
jgi:hypothetical protein